MIYWGGFQIVASPKFVSLHPVKKWVFKKTQHILHVYFLNNVLEVYSGSSQVPWALECEFP